MKNCSQLPSQPFKRKLYLGLLDAKRLLKYDKVKLENHLSCKCPLKKKKNHRKDMSSGNDFSNWSCLTTSRRPAAAEATSGAPKAHICTVG